MTTANYPSPPVPRSALTAVVAHLAAKMGCRVSTVIPNPRPDPYIQCTLDGLRWFPDGDFNETPYTDALINIKYWNDSPEKAEIFGRRIFAIMSDFRTDDEFWISGWVGGLAYVEDTSSNPNAATPRYVMTPVIRSRIEET